MYSMQTLYTKSNALPCHYGARVQSCRWLNPRLRVAAWISTPPEKTQAQNKYRLRVSYGKYDAWASLSNPSPAEPTHGSHCDITLGCKGGATLKAHSCALSDASPVLRDTMWIGSLTPGVDLDLEEDEPGDWKLVLQMVQPRTFPLGLVSWLNVRRLLHLADKYDIAVVRGFCAEFISRNTDALDLFEPLQSPKNPLMAATLVNKCCSSAEELKPYGDAVNQALENALVALKNPPSGYQSNDDVKTLLEILESLTTDERFHDTIAPSVQATVLSALIAGLRVFSKD